MKIGERIKELRIKNNMKQSDLGNALNVTGATISSWEIGRTEPRMGMIEKMCVLFHCSKTDIIEENDCKNPDPYDEFENNWYDLIEWENFDSLPHNQKALLLYAYYLKASPKIQKAVDDLLKPEQ